MNTTKKPKLSKAEKEALALVRKLAAEKKAKEEKNAISLAKLKKELKVSKPMDLFILYIIGILAVIAGLFIYFELFHIALACGLVLSFLGSMNCLVNNNKLAIPFSISFLIILITLFI